MNARRPPGRSARATGDARRASDSDERVADRSSRSNTRDATNDDGDGDASRSSKETNARGARAGTSVDEHRAPPTSARRVGASSPTSSEAIAFASTFVSTFDSVFGSSSDANRRGRSARSIARERAAAHAAVDATRDGSCRACVTGAGDDSRFSSRAPTVDTRTRDAASPRVPAETHAATAFAVTSTADERFGIDDTFANRRGRRRDDLR